MGGKTATLSITIPHFRYTIFCLFMFFLLETGSHCVAIDGLEVYLDVADLKFCLLLSPECWV